MHILLGIALAIGIVYVLVMTKFGRILTCVVVLLVVGVWGLEQHLESASEVNACKMSDSGWRNVPLISLQDHVSRFNHHCASLGYKTDCKLVQRPAVPYPGQSEDDRLREQLLHEFPVVEC